MFHHAKSSAITTSILLTLTILPSITTAANVLRQRQTTDLCGGQYGGCNNPTYTCRLNACTNVAPGECLGICVPYGYGGTARPNPGFQFDPDEDELLDGAAPEGYDEGDNPYVPKPAAIPMPVAPRPVPQQPQQGAPASPFSSGTTDAPGCVKGYNPACAAGTVCLGNPRNSGINPQAICVPPTRLCGGPTNAKCTTGFICVVDPRVSCNPDLGDRNCPGICV